jgi:phage gp36-like protein
LKGYLGTRFTLYNNSTPHTLVFWCCKNYLNLDWLFWVRYNK